MPCAASQFAMGRIGNALLRARTGALPSRQNPTAPLNIFRVSAPRAARTFGFGGSPCRFPPSRGDWARSFLRRTSGWAFSAYHPKRSSLPARCHAASSRGSPGNCSFFHIRKPSGQNAPNPVGYFPTFASSRSRA